MYEKEGRVPYVDPAKVQPKTQTKVQTETK
jgi:hypothetical protein